MDNNFGKDTDSHASHADCTQRGVALNPRGNNNGSIPEFQIGRLINERYQVEGVLGKGGFGVVYRVKDMQTGCDVALKTLKKNIEDYETSKKRFEREIELCNRISSEHAVKILDHGQSEEAVVYYVMELLEGCGLEEYIARRQEFPLVLTKKILLQALEALDEAHSKGIVHRDIKPSNIWLSNFDPEANECFVKILDFGIAKAIGDGDEKLTQTGSWMGSPQYMSPEHLRGCQATPASDCFALGLVAYEMLTHFPMVQAVNPMDAAMFVLKETEFEIDEWIAESSLGPVIQKAILKEPTQRYQSAHEFMCALKKLDDNRLRNEYSSAKIRGTIGNGKKTQQNTAPVIAQTTVVGISAEEQRANFIKLGLVIAIIILLLLIIILLSQKQLMAYIDERAGVSTTEEEQKPEHIRALEKGLVKGAGHGACELQRVSITLTVQPDMMKATVYREDGSIIGEIEKGKPLILEPIAIPMDAPNKPWNVIIKQPGSQDYPLAIIPKRTTTPTMDVRLLPAMPPGMMPPGMMPPDGKMPPGGDGKMPPGIMPPPGMMHQQIDSNGQNADDSKKSDAKNADDSKKSDAKKSDDSKKSDAKKSNDSKKSDSKKTSGKSTHRNGKTKKSEGTSSWNVDQLN